MILIRSAESRLGVVESLDSAMRGAGRTWELIRVPRQVARWGIFAGGGTMGLLLLKWLMWPRRTVASVAPAAVQRGGMVSVLGRLLVQALPVLLAPWLRSQMQSGGHILARLHPGRLFFRWLGLEK